MSKNATHFVFDHDKRDASKEISVHEREPGELEPPHVGVFRGDQRVGHLHGHGGGPAAARRLLNSNRPVDFNAKRNAWIERQDPTNTTAIDKAVTDARHQTDLAADRGSVTRQPTKPRAHARPCR